MYLGWDDMGDFDLYETREDMRTRMKELYGEEKDYRNDSLATWEFTSEMNIGDVVFAKKGRGCIIGRGIVTGDYEYDKSRDEYRHVRSVKWDKVGEWTLKEPLAMKTLTNVTSYANYVENLNKMLESRTEPETASNYWWLCANPKIWSMTGWMVGEEQDYTLYNTAGNKRRVFQHFLDARVGDKVICYEANPTKQISGLAVISKESDGERICFRKIETLASPVDLSEVKSMPELANMEFLVNPNGSFFHLTEKEYMALLDLIREENDSIHPERSIEKYTKADFLKEVFMAEKDFDTLRHLIRTKKNVILQGAPGVGKTFCARRLAQAMMGERDESRICLIQFHQNYSYEDFVMGYKPVGGAFELQKGIFYKFCMLAANHPDKEFFFIIDEINRGNLSKIFGELLMLIEKDYRGEKLTLAYKDEKFSVPGNLYLIGMMNTADRSLALIDYALRRRFSFFEMSPGFDSEGFKAYLEGKDNVRLNELVAQIKELNRQIVADDSLGKGFEIGHSYLCTKGEVTDEWLKEIVNYDILPMLREYWFDNRTEVDRWSKKLNGISMIKDRNIWIRNVYYMLAYAFEELKKNNYEQIAHEEFEHIQDLFAEILYKGVSAQLKRGLHREYINRVEDLPLLKGRLDIRGTIANQMRCRNVLCCEFDDLSENNLFNRVLKTTLSLLCHERNVSSVRKAELRTLLPFFSGVDEIDVRNIRWNDFVYQRNNQMYRMLMNVCYFIIDGMLMTTETGKYRMATFSDEHMCRLFEKFVLEYYRLHHRELSPNPDRIEWNIYSKDAMVIDLLPAMQSDIVLHRGDQSLVIDTKYYSHAMQYHFDKPTIHSANLYQIFTYVKNLDVKDTGNVSGLLLYAKTDEDITPDLSASFGKNHIRVRTLDLNQEFSGIASQLEEFLKW